MTTNERSFVDRIISGNGWLPEYPDHDAPDNPRATKIVEYVNGWGGTAYGVVMATDRDQSKYERESDFIRNPRVIWEPK